MPDASAAPDADPDAPGPTFHLYLTLLLGAIALTGGVDLVLDRPASWLSPHTVFEAAFLLLCLGTAASLGRGWLRSRRSLEDLRHSLDSRVQERDEWRHRAQALLAGLGEAIDAQMGAWKLTPSERETALFLLKGYSHKQIGELTQRSERTVRQHAVAVYRKSGLGGRAELSAFFLEDLLLPGSTPEHGD